MKKIEISRFFTYLQGLHHKSCWSRPYFARHFFRLLSEKRFYGVFIHKMINYTVEQNLCIMLNISFVKNLKNYHLTYFHYSTSSSHSSRVATVFCFSSYFVHNCLLLTNLDTFAYEVDVPYELDHSILLVLLDLNHATVKG